MYNIAIINGAQAKTLMGVEYIKDNYFNPVKIDDDIWFISDVELLSGYDKFDWFDKLELANFDDIVKQYGLNDHMLSNGK